MSINPFSQYEQNRREFFGKAMLGTGALAALALAEAGGAEAEPVSGTVFDVKQFGAKGDGRNNDTQPVQAAIRAAGKEAGGCIHFPSGHYRIAGSLLYESAGRLDITGCGWSSVLLHEENVPLMVWKPGVSCRGVSVRHLCITSCQTDKSPDTAAILCQSGMEQSFFSHLLFNAESASMGSGIVVEKVMDTSTIHQCLLWGVTGTGIQVAEGSEVRIFGGRIIGRDRYADKSIGVHLTGNNGGVHIVTTDIIALHTALKIGQAGNKSNREVFITHATFDSSIHGIVQVDGTYLSMAGCWSASSDEEQILLDKTAQGAILSITGGTIFNGGAYNKGGANHGLVVLAGSFMLSGVTVRHNKGTGILVGSNAVQDYAITGCRIADNGTGVVLDGNGYACTGNVLARNGTHVIDNGGMNKQVANNVITP